MSKYDCVPHNCRLCGKESIKRRSFCNTCISCMRRYRTKKAAVELLGGACQRCGWEGDICSFEFHHMHDNKEFTIGKRNNRAWETVKKEVLKCELLCSNCHRSEHCVERDEKFLAMASEYKGNLYDL